MYQNLFIYLAFALAIEGCRGHIRVKRIAESSKIAEKKTATSEIVATILKTPLKVVNDDVGAFQKGHALNTKRSTMDHSLNGERFMEDAKHNVWTTHETAMLNAQQHHPSDADESGNVTVVQTKNAVINSKGPEKSLTNNKIDEKSSEHIRLVDSSFERTTASLGTENRANSKDQHELSEVMKEPANLRVPRKASKYDGRSLSVPNPSSIYTGIDNHPFSHGSGEDDNIKKLIEDVKLEGHKKELKPDVDVFLYSNVPAFYKSPPVLFEMYNTKEALSAPSMDQLYPSYKWLQRRSPMQSALEFANMMVKVGLDELENEDYDSNFANKGLGHKFERNFGIEAGFCPVHTKKVSLNGQADEMGEGSSRFTGCVCSVGKNIKDASSKLEELNRIKRTYEKSEDHSELKSMLKPF